MIRAADLLLLPMHDLPNGNRARLVPCKTYEYLASGRPILAALPEGDARDLLAGNRRSTSAAPPTWRAMREILAVELGRPVPRRRPSSARRVRRLRAHRAGGEAGRGLRRGAGRGHARRRGSGAAGPPRRVGTDAQHPPAARRRRRRARSGLDGGEIARILPRSPGATCCRRPTVGPRTPGRSCNRIAAGLKQARHRASGGPELLEDEVADSPLREQPLGPPERLELVALDVELHHADRQRPRPPRRAAGPARAHEAT